MIKFERIHTNSCSLGAPT